MRQAAEERMKNLGVIALIGLLIFIIVFIYGLNAAHKFYTVWSQSKAGEAELAHAEYSRKIKTVEAEASKESAKFLAEAEVIRAEGVAKANLIIGDSLKGNDAYLRYLWISELKHGGKEVIYVPTEANLPILEAGKR